MNFITERWEPFDDLSRRKKRASLFRELLRKLKLRHYLMLIGALLIVASPLVWAATGTFAFGTLVLGVALWLISAAVSMTPSD